MGKEIMKKESKDNQKDDAKAEDEIDRTMDDLEAQSQEVTQHTAGSKETPEVVAKKGVEQQEAKTQQKKDEKKREEKAEEKEEKQAEQEENDRKNEATKL